MMLKGLPQLESGPFGIFICNLFLMQLNITHPNALGVKNLFSLSKVSTRMYSRHKKRKEIVNGEVACQTTIETSISQSPPPTYE